MGRVIAVDPECVNRLAAHPWPGNVRELENVIELAVITSCNGRLNLDRALPPSSAPSAAPDPVDEGSILTIAQMEQLERGNIERALAASAGRITGAGGAAQRLGINPSTLRSRMKALGIDRNRAL